MSRILFKKAVTLLFVGLVLFSAIVVSFHTACRLKTEEPLLDSVMNQIEATKGAEVGSLCLLNVIDPRFVPAEKSLLVTVAKSSTKGCKVYY